MHSNNKDKSGNEKRKQRIMKAMLLLLHAGTNTMLVYPRVTDMQT